MLANLQIRALHPHHDLLRPNRFFEQGKSGPFPGRGFHIIDGQDKVALPDPRRIRRAINLDLTDQRLYATDTRHENQVVSQYRKQEVECRPRRDYGKPPTYD